MYPRAIASFVLICLLAAAAAAATERIHYTLGGEDVQGGGAGGAKAVSDTIDLMGPTGSGAAYSGDFEDGWSGWTSFDWTQVTVSHWQVSGYNQAVAGNLAAWCGDLEFASCDDSLDAPGGYGNSWHDRLAYRTTVADPAAAATVTVTATLQNDTEPAYDYTHLSMQVAGSIDPVDVRTWDGTQTVAAAASFTYLPGELVDGTDVVVMFRFASDGGWSDADCSYPSAGACQVDDITVTTSQAGRPDIVSFTDFQDGTFGDWAIAYPPGVGDFARIWRGLADVDPCQTNFSNQVAFIDDGTVVPGTGGSRCINWCYGPGGFIVNTTGGLAGPTGHINNDIRSPVMTWPDDDYHGIIVAFDVYRHEDLSADAPGIFYTMGTASADTDGSGGHGVQDIADQPFLRHNSVYYGGPDYIRFRDDVTDLMNRGRDQVRVRMGVYELGWAWGWIGDDGYPAPYFDNVSVKIYRQDGPGMRSRELDLANDDFIAADVIDTSDLGSLHVRFDMADNISLRTHLRNDPGDTMVVDIVPVRPGASLVGAPLLHYVIDANPLFDPYRTTPTSGAVAGSPAVGVPGFPDPDAWAFDLPDTGTLFPGDVLHYYVRAGDEVAGDVRWATLPTDLAGFGDFSHPLAYNSTFVIHALPTITADGFGGYRVPPILFWNDFANRGGEAEWYGALDNLGLTAGVDYDIYYTNGPSSGVGNGLGGRTDGPALAMYDILLYTSGDLGVNTISNGDFDNDAGDDIGVLRAWLAAGDRGVFLTGDDVASDLAINAGPTGAAFAAEVMGVDVVTDDVRGLIGNQVTPLVLALPGNPVFDDVGRWIAYGGCFGINRFDGVTVLPGAVRLAEFGDSSGNPGAYPFAAATLNPFDVTDRIVSLPYDFMSVYTDPGAPAGSPLPARARVLADVLEFFGGAVDRWSPAVGHAAFATSHAPNPFNPAVRISYTVPAPGRLTLRIYDVRGRLVRTLRDERVAADGFVVWDGRTDGGAAVASGIYFSEARLGGEVRVGKLSLIR